MKVVSKPVSPAENVQNLTMIYWQKLHLRVKWDKWRDVMGVTTSSTCVTSFLPLQTEFEVESVMECQQASNTKNPLTYTADYFLEK